MRKTKIVCTMGPSTRQPQVIRSLIEAGMNVARLNLSHEEYNRHAETCKMIREERAALNKHIAILLDTKGPEVRVGKLTQPIEIFKGDTIELTSGNEQNDERIPIRLPQLYEVLHQGDEIRINDGLIALTVISVNGENVTCRVRTDGELRSNKGVNFPQVDIGLPFLSERGKSDLLFGIEQEVDFVAASFVRTEQDIIDMKQFLQQNGGESIKVIAKIENRQSVDNIDSILASADGVMIARGDLGVEINYAEIPAIQKRIIKKAYQLGKPAITATQMLESMIHSPRPTRAETSDIANAVFDGTSAVMLSGETAVGEYPVEAVRSMAEIAITAERCINYEAKLLSRPFSKESDKANAISHAACIAAVSVGAKAIFSLSDDDMTAAYLAKFRPPCDIFALSGKTASLRRNNLNWGVTPLKAIDNTTKASSTNIISSLGIIKGDKVIAVENTSVDGQTEYSMKILTI